MSLNRSVREPAMPRLEAVLFDFGGTLDAEGVPAIEQFRRGYSASGGRRSPEEFEAFFRESDRRLAAEPAILTFGFHQTIAAQSQLLAKLMDDEPLDAARIATLVHDAAARAAERSGAVLQSLRSRGLHIGVISNFTGNLDRCLRELGLAAHVDVAIDSAVVGVRKPERAIFLLALERLGVQPGGALMVGDNPYADIRAAASIGLATCWLAPLTRSVPEGCAPTFRITRLVDLLALLEHASTNPLVLPCTG